MKDMRLDRRGHVSLWLFHATLWLVGVCTDPLLLSPFLEKGDIKSALQLSEVRDPKEIIPKSYAGFITVDKKLGNHLFFWFFPVTLRRQAPVVVWLNGGPTISSMLGLLWENGPIRVTGKILVNGDGISALNVTYTKWEKSWAQSFSMLYIDNPVGTGYSYSDSGRRGWKTTTNGYTEDLFSFISQFYMLFPDYLKTELYIGGQSYAGKFVPTVALRIHKEIQANRSALPLAGIYLGGPYFDPYVQSSVHGRFYYSLGAVSYAQFVNHQKAVREIFEKNDTHGETLLSLFIKLTHVTSNIRYNYNIREQSGNSLVDYLMNTQEIRQMVHVGSKLQFKAANTEIEDYYVSDILVSTKSQLAEIMDNYKVLIYSGDFDGIVTTVATEEAILSIPWSLQAVYNQSDRQQWNQIVGYYTHVGRFCRVIVRHAGHLTTRDQPLHTRMMMSQFVVHGCVRTGDWTSTDSLTDRSNQSTLAIGQPTGSTPGEKEEVKNESAQTSRAVYVLAVLLLISTAR